MKNLSTVIITTLITFLVTFGLNAGFSYFGSNKGTVGVDQYVNLENISYSIVEIKNHSSKTIDNLKVNIPIDVEFSKISSSSPVLIKHNNKIKNKRLKQIIISEIPPNRLSRIFIPISGLIINISTVNHKETGLSLININNIENPMFSAFKSALILSTAYAMVFFIFDLIQKNRTISLKEEIVRIENKQKLHEVGLNYTSKKLSKTSILLQARLFDFSKELTFWRDTVRKMLYKSNNKIDSDIIINTITESLKTYGARQGKAVDFESIRVMASMLNEKESSSHDSK